MPSLTLILKHVSYVIDIKLLFSFSNCFYIYVEIKLKFKSMF